jgi:hypothetical protein
MGRAPQNQLTGRQVIWLTVAALPAAVPPLLDSSIGLAPSIALALAFSAVLSLRIIRRGRTLKPVLYGAIGAALAAGCLLVFGSVRNLFLPGLVFSTVWAPIVLLSGMTRWPFIGVLLARLDRRFVTWRHNPRLLRVFRGLTIAWGLFACARVALQWWLYEKNKGDWLVVSRHVSNLVLLGLALVTIRIAVRLHRGEAMSSTDVIGGTRDPTLPT